MAPTPNSTVTAPSRRGGMAVYIQEEGASLPIEASPYQTGRLGPREKLLHALHTADRLLVLGGPGSTGSPQRPVRDKFSHAGAENGSVRLLGRGGGVEDDSYPDRCTSGK